MQALFESERRPAHDLQASLRRALNELSDADEAFAQELLVGVQEHLDHLKEVIQVHAPGWSIERMDPISRCVLTVGCYELLHRSDVPPAVVMDEAIDIAKEYGSAEGGKFVNGVLNAIAKGTR